jgi:hypothetical protein
VWRADRYQEWSHSRQFHCSWLTQQPAYWYQGTIAWKTGIP